MDKNIQFQRAITVYCGSSSGNSPAYKEAAQALGEYLGTHRIELVYGGGKKGLMGQVADSALAKGGKVIGIIPSFMVDLEWAHTGLTKLELVETMSDRKEKLLALGDAIIILPGGVGTLEEFSEVLSWSQLHIHRKAIGFLNIEGYYNDFFRFFDHLIEEGFCPASTKDLFVVEDNVTALLEALSTFSHHGKLKTTN